MTGRLGSIGIIMDENNNPLYTTTMWPPLLIALDPGEEVSFLGFTLYGMDGLEVGDLVDINPKYYIESGLDNMYADSSLLINLVAVPIPPATLLFGSGLLGLIGVARRKVRV